VLKAYGCLLEQTKKYLYFLAKFLKDRGVGEGNFFQEVSFPHEKK
jgi:hypothetical protein